ncbi:hypothetical protein IFM89_011335 [Coptis chinensis]|uniref:Plant heme peroxidase family profile domain-containing protein n=1 Tax=Coptis chinensis TaxID=261450 RepID=A0A835ISQ4_9MAGN|nr:hypothetical protein IFM89_011335 [Coptis chinensis]
MAAISYSNKYSLFSILIFITVVSSPVLAQLSVGFYGRTCPSVYDTVRAATRSVINREPRMGASLIRLFFHDCFVNGCDGGVLLDDTASTPGEKGRTGNINLLRGFEVIDNIKVQVDRACGRVVVSCADIVAIAARDSVVESGAHTLGQARCALFRDRIYNETNIDPSYRRSLQANCPRVSPNGDNNLAPLDEKSPNRFGNSYFQSLMNRRGLLHSDQVLFNGATTDSIVREYSNDPRAFLSDFSNSMLKMGNKLKF